MQAVIGLWIICDMSRSLGDYERPLFAPVELVKHQSVVKGQAIAATLVVGHPLYHWAWTHLDPRPYDSLTWRLVASMLRLVALFCVWLLGARDLGITAHEVRMPLAGMQLLSFSCRNA